MILHTLLLNSSYEAISFVTERKCFKLLANNKVEVLESWPLIVPFGNDKIIHHPAVIRLLYQVRWVPKKANFNRLALFRRDQYVCQYCFEAAIPKDLTVDHIVPASRGGEWNWFNCVTSCFPCNNKKRNRTPEEAGMALKIRPFVPKITIISDYQVLSDKHESWERYIGYLK